MEGELQLKKWKEEYGPNTTFFTSSLEASDAERFLEVVHRAYLASSFALDLQKELKNRDTEIERLKMELKIKRVDDNQGLLNQIKIRDKELQKADEVAEKARNLYDNRLGWSEGRHPYAPQIFWHKVEKALANYDKSRGSADASGENLDKLILSKNGVGESPTTPQPDNCPACGGSGERPFLITTFNNHNSHTESKETFEPCPKCKGTGKADG